MHIKQPPPLDRWHLVLAAVAAATGELAYYVSGHAAAPICGITAIALVIKAIPDDR